MTRRDALLLIPGSAGLMLGLTVAKKAPEPEVPAITWSRSSGAYPMRPTVPDPPKPPGYWTAGRRRR